ncbi:MAG: cytochrome c oxidase subunit 3 [Thermodesulfobacteriota bacterium]
MSPERTRVLDVSRLETFGFGSRGVTWWGVNCFIAIEATMLFICLASYFYLQSQAPEWPIGRVPPPLSLATLNLVVLLASVVPMAWTERAARKMDLRRVRLGLVTSIAFGLAFSLIRIFGLASLPYRWDAHVYWSLVWTTIGLHTAHLAAEVLETIVIAAAVFRGDEIEPKLYVDVEDNAFYWYFIVAIWVPIYAVIYVSPRLL